MKRPKKRTSAVAKANDEPSIVPREEREELRPGDVVMLPGGDMASVERIVGRDAYVVEWQKTVGRGPWIFPISDLVPVT